MNGSTSIIDLMGTPSLGRPPVASRVAESGSFENALAAANSASVVETAEGLVGTTVQPSVGGCACGTFVDVVAERPVQPAASQTTLKSGMGPRPKASAGDLIVLADRAGATAAKPHVAIARSGSEMIAPNGGGVVQIMPIPWNLVIGIQRLR